MTSSQLNAVVVSRNEISPWLTILRVVPDGWQLPSFTPGQFTVLGLPGSARRSELSEPEERPIAPDKLVRRAYSIASSSLIGEYMEFYIALVTTGALTPRLFALNIGDRIWLSKKVTGLFTLKEVPPDKNIVMIATGTGLAPYMSMLTSHLTCGGSNRTAVLHGARHSWDLGYLSELMTLKHLCINLTYAPIISRPADEPVPWGGHTGYVQDLWMNGAIEREWRFRPTPANTHVFLSGSPAMIVDTAALLSKEGFREHTRKESGQFHVERYW